MLMALAKTSRSCWLGWLARWKRFSSAVSCVGDILLRVLRCRNGPPAPGAGLDELASESVALYDVPLAVYNELSDEERSTEAIFLRLVAGIAENENREEHKHEAK